MKSPINHFSSGLVFENSLDFSKANPTLSTCCLRQYEVTQQNIVDSIFGSVTEAPAGSSSSSSRPSRRVQAPLAPQPPRSPALERTGPFPTPPPPPRCPGLVRSFGPARLPAGITSISTSPTLSALPPYIPRAPRSLSHVLDRGFVFG